MTTVTGTHPIRRTETRRVPRTTGALSGLLVIVLGVWGGLIPFIGPYFHYAFGGYKTWHYTSERLWLCIIPGVVAVIGGLMLLRSSRRSSGLLGGWLALAAGAWFAIGPTISLLWHHAGDPIGAPMGGYTRQTLEWLGYFTGLGVVIAALSAFAMGRYFSRPRVVEEAAVAEDEAAMAERDAPVAGHEAPVAGHEAPMAATAAGEPVAARETEPLAPREPEPLAPREPEPIVDRDEPVAPANEPVAPANEPVAPSDEPTAVREDQATSPEDATGTPSTVTYRRRPGLSRFRRR